MPRKNQKRKNANKQSTRKPKPIKFNPSELENEQKCLQSGAMIENDEVDDREEKQDMKPDVKLELESTDNKNDNDSQECDNDDNDGRSPTPLSTTSHEIKVDQINQKDDADDGNTDSTILVIDTDSFASMLYQIFDNYSCIYHFIGKFL